MKPKKSQRKNLSQRQRRRRWLYAQHQYDTPMETHATTFVPYAERLEGTSRKTRLLEPSDFNDEAVNESMNLRGGHLVTVGLGPNGQVGDPVVYNASV